MLHNAGKMLFIFYRLSGIVQIEPSFQSVYFTSNRSLCCLVNLFCKQVMELVIIDRKHGDNSMSGSHPYL